jgi:hypothetical protein
LMGQLPCNQPLCFKQWHLSLPVHNELIEGPRRFCAVPLECLVGPVHQRGKRGPTKQLETQNKVRHASKPPHQKTQRRPPNLPATTALKNVATAHTPTQTQSQNSESQRHPKRNHSEPKLKPPPALKTSELRNNANASTPQKAQLKPAN